LDVFNFDALFIKIDSLENFSLDLDFLKQRLVFVLQI